MAYCRNCGAYVPDGQNKCLACGFEEPGQAEKKPENGGAAAQAREGEQFQEELRRRRQENDRLWAEAEHARRQAQQARQEAQRARAEAWEQQRQAYEARQQQRYEQQARYGGQGFYPYISPRSRLIALLLCAFLGPTGAHNFYVGRMGRGLLFLFTGGLFGIGWVIDLIRILTGRFRDGNGAFVSRWDDTIL